MDTGKTGDTVRDDGLYAPSDGGVPQRLIRGEEFPESSNGNEVTWTKRPFGFSKHLVAAPPAPPMPEEWKPSNVQEAFENTWERLLLLEQAVVYLADTAAVTAKHSSTIDGKPVALPWTDTTIRVGKDRIADWIRRFQEYMKTL